MNNFHDDNDDTGDECCLSLFDAFLKMNFLLCCHFYTLSSGRRGRGHPLTMAPFQCQNHSDLETVTQSYVIMVFMHVAFSTEMTP